MSDTINNAVHKVCNPGLYDMHSKEFMLDAFKSASPPEDFDPNRTVEDIISDGLMRHSSLYRSVMEYLLKENPDEQ